MRIEEVEDILNTLRLLGLLAPQHVFITDEPITQHTDGQVLYRGLAPMEKRGVMVLSRHADVTTVPHELIHAAFGLGEAVAYPAGKLLALRYKLTKALPVKLPKLLRVKYRESTVPKKYKGRIKHYKRVT